MSNIQGRIDTLIEEASGKFHEYIHGNDLRQTILYKTDTFTRFSIGQELDKRIYCNTRAWQETNIGDIFQKTIMTDLRQKFVNIHISLQEIKDNLTGFKSPFDVNEKITLAIASGMISSGAVLIAGLPVEPSVTRETLFQIAGAAVLAGVATSVLVKFEAIYDFKTVRENAFKARINAFSKEEIKYNLKEGCAETIQTIIETFLGEGLKSEIDKMKENISTLENEHEFFVSEKETLSSLQSTVKQNIKDLKQIEKIGLNFE